MTTILNHARNIFAFTLLFVSILVVASMEQCSLSDALSGGMNDPEVRILVANSIPWGDKGYQQPEMYTPKDITYIWAGDMLLESLMYAVIYTILLDHENAALELDNFWYLLIHGKGEIVWLEQQELSSPPQLI